jgi:hypothetical protein
MWIFVIIGLVIYLGVPGVQSAVNKAFGLKDTGDVFSTSGSTTTTPSDGASQPTGKPDDSPSGAMPSGPDQAGMTAGLPVVAGDAKAAARTEIEKVRTAGRGAKTGYDREQFGKAWADKNGSGGPFDGNGCDTRNDILNRDMTNVVYKDAKKCLVQTGTIYDPYTNKTIEFNRTTGASKVQIDHVIPLSLAWQMGAAHWPAEKRLAFANDPVNLIAVDGPTNGSKSDSSIATWLPPNKGIRCAYALRVAQVSLRYDLPMTDSDKNMALNQCA